ncbi:hypothetical protein HK104_001704, partial [Borealophlyctis nickersoniae]
KGLQLARKERCAGGAALPSGKGACGRAGGSVGVLAAPSAAGRASTKSENAIGKCARRCNGRQAGDEGLKGRKYRKKKKAAQKPDDDGGGCVNPEGLKEATEAGANDDQEVAVDAETSDGISLQQGSPFSPPLLPVKKPSPSTRIKRSKSLSILSPKSKLVPARGGNLADIPGKRCVSVSEIVPFQRSSKLGDHGGGKNHGGWGVAPTPAEREGETVYSFIEETLFSAKNQLVLKKRLQDHANHLARTHATIALQESLDLSRERVQIARACRAQRRAEAACLNNLMRVLEEERWRVRKAQLEGHASASKMDVRTVDVRDNAV